MDESDLYEEHVLLKTFTDPSTRCQKKRCEVISPSGANALYYSRRTSARHTQTRNTEADHAVSIAFHVLPNDQILSSYPPCILGD